MNDETRKLMRASYDYIEWLEARCVLPLFDEPETGTQLREAWRAAFDPLLPTADDVRGILR